MGCPTGPIFCSAKPISRATNRVCRMLSFVSAESREVGIMPSRKLTVSPPPWLPLLLLGRVYLVVAGA